MDMLKENKANENEIKYGICPVCKVRNNDLSTKILYKCKYCGEYFCEKHITPKLTLSRNQIERIIKDPILKGKLYEEWRNENKHPDRFYTYNFLEKLEESEKIKIEKIIKFLESKNKIEEDSYTKEKKLEEYITQNNIDTIKKMSDNKIYEKSNVTSNIELNNLKPANKNKKIKLKYIVSIIFILSILALIYLELEKYFIFFNPNPEEINFFELPIFLRVFGICPEKYEYKDGGCYYYLRNNPISKRFTYCWFGEKRELTVTLYEGANIYFNKLAEREACNEDLDTFYLKSIEDEEQIKFIREIVEYIKRIPTSRDNWARIAISLVQNIPYDYESFYNPNFKCQYETLYFFVINKKILGAVPRYPYNVLYENKSICNEKSRLLALLLKELGYGVVLLEFVPERHMAVGIKCPKEYANYIYNNTGYCFIESSKPVIITYNYSDYERVGKLYSTPKIIFISDGYSFDSVYIEYVDARRFKELNEIAEKKMKIRYRMIYTTNGYQLFENIVYQFHKICY